MTADAADNGTMQHVHVMGDNVKLSALSEIPGRHPKKVAQHYQKDWPKLVKTEAVQKTARRKQPTRGCWKRVYRLKKTPTKRSIPG